MQMLIRAPNGTEKGELPSLIRSEFYYLHLAGFDLVYGRLNLKVGQGKTVADGFNVADTNSHLLVVGDGKLAGIPVDRKSVV